MNIKRAEFVKSGTQPAHYPEWGLREIAFAGRSNVGKSSLINTLVQRHGLVKVSRTPGHTRLINFFSVVLEDDRELGVVDLPGYGFAKVSAGERASWGKMIETYFTRRESLKAMILVMDLRRGMTELDRHLFDNLGHFGMQPILVFTKADKLSRNQQQNALRQHSRDLGIPERELLLFSSHTNLGRDALWARICQTALPAADAP